MKLSGGLPILYDTRNLTLPYGIATRAHRRIVLVEARVGRGMNRDHRKRGEGGGAPLVIFQHEEFPESFFGPRQVNGCRKV